MGTHQFIPELFLSHSGHQKSFVWRLYQELCHVNHTPFFDQDARDSLPKGEPFPARIVEGCRTCKLGIVVISHQYIDSMWPMLELQELLFNNPSSPHNVYPIFYNLGPADLCKQENLDKWKKSWEGRASRWHARNSSITPPLTLDIESWPKALEMLRYQNGQIHPGNNQDEHPFIQAIVSNICKRFPSPNSLLLGAEFKGVDHIQQEIHKYFQQEDRNEEIGESCGRLPICVGLYGVGGSGKTTVCKYMVNFYNRDQYPGRCCFLEFPTSEKDEGQKLLQSMKNVLLTIGQLAKETLESITSVDQAMPHLQELLRRYKVFLILDNVWDWALLIAKGIVEMGLMPGSKLLVTARSGPLLETLSKELGSLDVMKIVHVPSISEEEAVEALVAYSFNSSLYTSNAKDLRDLALSCFFGKQCHPLLLKAVGTRLRSLGAHACSPQDWTQCISRLMQTLDNIHNDEKIEATVVNVLKTSYDALDSKLQDLFMKLGTCNRSRSLSNSCEWLSMIIGGGSHTIENIRDQLIVLEYHGLIKIHGKYIEIHDLQMVLIEKMVQKNGGVSEYLWFFVDVATPSASECRRYKYVDGFYVGGTCLKAFSSERRWWKHIHECFPCDQRAATLTWSSIEVLKLEGRGFGAEGSNGSLRFSVWHMKSLRHLCLECFSNLKVVGGWRGARNLVSIKLNHCENLQRIDSMSCLSRLESLVIEECFFDRKRWKGINDVAEFLGPLPRLQVLELSGGSNFVNVGDLSVYPSLQRCVLSRTGIVKFLDFNLTKLRVLDLSGCERLESIEGSVCGLTALEELSCRGCFKLESIPVDLTQLTKLKRLELGRCRSLKQEVKVGEPALTSLESLSLYYGFCHLSVSKEVKVGEAVQTSLSPILPSFSAFINLRRLEVWDVRRGEENADVGSWSLPVSLEELHLSYLDNIAQQEIMTSLSALVNLEQFQIAGWQSIIEITGLSAHVNLKKLNIMHCPSLTRITGLGTLAKLKVLSISDCESLREVGHWEDPFISRLTSVYLRNCPKLETPSMMEHLSSLTKVVVDESPLIEQDLQEGKFLHTFRKAVFGSGNTYQRI